MCGGEVLKRSELFVCVGGTCQLVSLAVLSGHACFQTRPYPLLHSHNSGFLVLNRVYICIQAYFICMVLLWIKSTAGTCGNGLCGLMAASCLPQSHEDTWYIHFTAYCLWLEVEAVCQIVCLLLVSWHTAE